MPNRDHINAELALELKKAGLTWDQVALELSVRDQRQPPYHGCSVAAVVSRHKRAKLLRKAP